MMTDLSIPLRTLSGHAFLETDDGLWLMDTGAPQSFGVGGEFKLGQRRFPVGSEYAGLGVDALAECLGVECRGLIGSDILNRFDFVLDLPGENVLISENELDLIGTQVSLDAVMGIPALGSKIAGDLLRLFFDTGAQISYVCHNVETRPVDQPSIEDFYPGFGRFRTSIGLIEFEIGGSVETLRCGSLPEPLSMALLATNVQGIVGLDLIKGRRALYSPRRGLLGLGERQSE